MTERHVLDENAGSGPPLARPNTHLLTEVLDGHDNVLVFCHMNPDPDSIASALAMGQLLETRFGKAVTLCYRGIIGRAQNRQMRKLLAPELHPFHEVESLDFTAAILVDAQPEFGFEAGDVLEQDVPIVACIDHHPFVETTRDVPYHDVRPGLGSTSTIMTGYLRLFSVVPSSQVATALYYGIDSDTLGLTRRTTNADREASEYLLPMVAHDALTSIRQPPLSMSWFSDLNRAMADARRHGDLVVSCMGSLAYPDIVAEMADFFLKAEDIHWSVVMGRFKDRLYCSVRTDHADGDAGELIRHLAGDLGQAGGHNTMAAARVKLPDGDEEFERLSVMIRKRLIDHFGSHEDDGIALVG